MKTSSLSEHIMNLIKTRRSIRIFTGKKIPKKDILSIIEAGVWAPSGCNMQELRFLILDKKADIKKIVKFKPFLQKVSHIILLFYDLSLPESKKMYIYSSHQKFLPYIDAGLALANMALYAKSIGVASCITNLSEHFYQPTTSLFKKIINRALLKMNLFFLAKTSLKYVLKKQFKIPAHLKIIGGIALGYAKIQPNLNFAMHSGRKIKRDNIKKYIIK